MWLLVEGDSGKAAAALDPKRCIGAHPPNGFNDLSVPAQKILIPDRFMMGNAIAELQN